MSEALDGGRGISGDKRDWGDRKAESSRKKSDPDFVEQGPEAIGGDGVIKVEPVRVELLDAACCHDDTSRPIGKLDDVQSLQQGMAEGSCQAVVGRVGEGEEIDGGLRLGADDGAASMLGAAGGDRDGEEIGLGHGENRVEILTIVQAREKEDWNQRSALPGPCPRGLCTEGDGRAEDAGRRRGGAMKMGRASWELGG